MKGQTAVQLVSWFIRKLFFLLPLQGEDQQAGAVTHHRFIGLHWHFMNSRERTKCKKPPTWLQVDDLHCFLRVCLPSSWCFVPMAITEVLSLIDTVNEHYTIYLKTKSPPLLIWVGREWGKEKLRLCWFFYVGLKAHLGEPALSVQKHNRWILLMDGTCGWVQARVVIWI